MNTRELFIKAVQAASNIPEAARANVSSVGEVRDAQMTQSYLDFLEHQSQNNPRGPKWEDVMQRRRANMLAYRDAQIVDGIIPFDGRSCYVMVASAKQTVIHWEMW